MFDAAIDSKDITITSDHPAYRRVMSILQTSRIGQAMKDVLTATHELRRVLEERDGEDAAEAVMRHIDKGIDAAWRAIEKQEDEERTARKR